MPDHCDPEAQRDADGSRGRPDGNASGLCLQASAELSRDVNGTVSEDHGKLIAAYSRAECVHRQPRLGEQVRDLPDHIVTASEPVGLVDHLQPVDIHVDD
jgi:hypothetical protein